MNPQAQPTPSTEPPQDTPPPAPVAWVGTKTPPNTYDLMRAPVYCPGPGPVMRAGATDFLQCPSRGH